ncbi:hypothetical protein ABM90_03910 [Rhodococcus erythropolis]|nr:hypothetical protein ABM90_03910 [Rhodococcus erythropolis]
MRVICHDCGRWATRTTQPHIGARMYCADNGPWVIVTALCTTACTCNTVQQDSHCGTAHMASTASTGYAAKHVDTKIKVDTRYP